MTSAAAPTPAPGRLRRTLLPLLLASLCSTSWAGSFSVSPVRIYMKPRDRAVAITLTNAVSTTSGRLIPSSPRK